MHSLYVVLDPSAEHTANTHWGAPPKQLLISKQTDNYIKLLEYDAEELGFSFCKPAVPPISYTYIHIQF